MQKFQMQHVRIFALIYNTVAEDNFPQNLIYFLHGEPVSCS